MRFRHALTPALLSCALVLTGCGSGDEQDDPSDATTSASPSAAPTTESSVAPATGRKFSGDGYSFRAPKGWSDATRTAKDLNELVELAAAAEPDDSGFATNLNVVVADAGVDEPSDDLLQEVSDAIATRLSELVPKLKINPHTEVAGKPSLHHEGAATKSGVNYYIDQFVAFDGGNAYTITFSFSRNKTAKQRAAVVDQVLAGWTWQ